VEEVNRTIMRQFAAYLFSKGQADRVIEFVRADSPLAESVNAQYIITKETERPKYLAKQIKKLMNDEGFKKFNLHHHTQLWKNEDAKNPDKGYGVIVANTWYWYERWVNFVRTHCNQNKDHYQ
jgi:hypothetical protein